MDFTPEFMSPTDLERRGVGVFIDLRLLPPGLSDLRSLIEDAIGLLAWGIPVTLALLKFGSLFAAASDTFA